MKLGVFWNLRCNLTQARHIAGSIGGGGSMRQSFQDIWNKKRGGGGEVAEALFLGFVVLREWGFEGLNEVNEKREEFVHWTTCMSAYWIF